MQGLTPPSYPAVLHQPWAPTFLMGLGIRSTKTTGVPLPATWLAKGWKKFGAMGGNKVPKHFDAVFHGKKNGRTTKA